MLAMKLLAGELSQNRDVVRRFKQEALTVSRLSNPYTVRAVGSCPGTIDPKHLMVVPNVDGHEVAKVCDWSRQVAGEFELSSDLAGLRRRYALLLPRAGPRGGSRWAGDLYSLGAVMFRALTRNTPSRRTPMAMFTKHLTEPPPRPTEEIPSLSSQRPSTMPCTGAWPRTPRTGCRGWGSCVTSSCVKPMALGCPNTSACGSVSTTKRPLRLLSQTYLRTGLFEQQLATRAEARALRAQASPHKYSAYIMLGALLVVVGVLIGLGIQRGTEAFTGLEAEPNNTRDAANPLPLERDMRASSDGVSIRAMAIAASCGSLLPGEQTEQSLVRLSATALPNIATATSSLRAGYREAVARYCVGYPGQDLVVPAVRLVGGEYYLVLTQDLEQEGRPPYVYENVSDSYRVRVGRVSPAAHEEIEPNDRDAIAQQVEPGSEVVGTLPWRGDEDVYCAPSSFQGALRWEIEMTVVRLERCWNYAACVRHARRSCAFGAKSKPFNVMRLPADVNSRFRASTRLNTGSAAFAFGSLPTLGYVRGQGLSCEPTPPSTGFACKRSAVMALLQDAPRG